MNSGAVPVLVDPELDGLSRLDSDEERRSWLDRNPALVQPESVEALAEAVRRYVRVDVRLALGCGDAAMAVAERLGDHESVARALRAKGNAHWFEGKCRAAVDLLDKATDLFDQVNCAGEVARTLSTSIQPLILLGEYEAALRNASRAREIFTAIGDGLRLARLDINVANVYHRQERFADALEAYQSAYRQLLPHGDGEGLGAALHNMAVCLISLDDFERALDIYHHAREFLVKQGMPKLVEQADYNIACLYQLRGDYERAIELLRSTRENCADSDPYHAALCDLDLSEIYLELNLVEEARQMAARAVESFERLGIRYELARSTANLAIAAALQGQVSRAMALFENAKNRFADERCGTGEALVNLYQAMLLANTGEPAEARRLCSNAAEVFRRSDLRRKAALCDLLLARLALAEGDLEVAGRHCDAADERLRELHAPLLNFQAQLERGRILETQGDDSGSRRCYTAAAADLEMLRGALQGEDLKIAFSSTKLEVYERLAALALKDGLRGPPAEEAFAFMERAKSRSLAESLLGRSAPLSRPAPANGSSAAELRRRREDLNWFYHRIRSEEIREHGPDPARLESLWTSARARENQLLELVRESRGWLGSQQPGLDGAFAGLSEIRAALESGSVLVQYFQIGDRMLAGVLTPAALEIVPLAKASTVRKRLRLMQLQVSLALVRPRSGRRQPRASGAGMIPHLQALYHDLVAPLEPHLTGGHLVLAPHGCLHYVPLHALHDGRQHLIDRFTVSYVPSASVYLLCRRSTPPSGTRSLIVGVDDHKAPWIVDEVREVASAVPDALVLTGSDARLSELERWGADSRLIHIASHGSFRSDNPLFSAIRLADSYLSVYDLYNTRLPADLLTLSGCATGLNVVAAGDELLGLVRGLLCAGARSLLLTLWDIDDRGTAEFMRHFYTRLQAGEGKAHALRHAMWEMRERYPHPAYWAPFVLVGNLP